jgi:hypothetical protein
MSETARRINANINELGREITASLDSNRSCPCPFLTAVLKTIVQEFKKGDDR